MDQNINEHDNINEIVKRLFSEDYKPPKSIQLQLEEESSFLAQSDYANYIFELMCLITLGGIEYIYGHKNILSLSEDQFNTIQYYINSIGYKIVLETNGKKISPWELSRFNIPITSYRISFEPC